MGWLPVSMNHTVDLQEKNNLVVVDSTIYSSVLFRI